MCSYRTFSTRNKHPVLTQPILNPQNPFSAPKFWSPGYYTTVHGLGVEPRDVSFEGSAGVHQAEPGRNLIQFWRGAENLRNAPASGKMVWSVRSTPHQY